MAPLSTSGAAQMLPMLADLLNSILNIHAKCDSPENRKGVGKERFIKKGCLVRAGEEGEGRDRFFWEWVDGNIYFFYRIFKNQIRIFGVKEIEFIFFATSGLNSHIRGHFDTNKSSPV
jgi:hypothetical protein